MKKFFKTAASVMAVAVVASAFAGCGGGSKTASTDGKNFTYWCIMDGNVRVDSYNDMLYYQKLNEATGKNITFLHPAAGSEGAEAFTTTLASGKENLPDMMEYPWQVYPGGPEKAISDGAIVRLNDYINEDITPNYYDFMNGKMAEEYGDLFEKQSKTDSGSYFGFNNLNIGKYRGFSGLYVRMDLLEQWGLGAPETITDWDNLFKTAKENGIDVPFTCQSVAVDANSTEYHSFNTAFGVGKYFYLEGDKVVFGPAQPGYKEFVAQMTEWYSKGYIDVDYPTNTADAVQDNLINGKSVASFGWIGSSFGKIVPAAEAKGIEGFKLVACPFPGGANGEVAEFQQVQVRAGSPYIAITSNCGNIEEAAKWCDFIYSEEGNEYHTFGEEGNTYTKTVDADGVAHYEYTDKIRKPETNKDFEFSISSVNEALYAYMRPANGPGINQHPDYLNGFYPYQEQLDALEIWNSNVDKAGAHALPTLYYTDKESERNSDLTASLDAELNTMINSIISGKLSVDSYDAEIKKLMDKGYNELCDIRQAAYDRYLKR